MAEQPPPYSVTPPPVARKMSGEAGAPPSISPPRQAEIKLYSNAGERRKYEDMADLYSIIKATEHLEAAFARDAVLPDEYSAACSKLISQFKTTEMALVQASVIIDTRSFMSEHHMDCPRAMERLLRMGVPATVMNPVQDDRGEAVKVAETVQNFITAMDAVKLEQRAVDEIQPLISDIMTSLARVSGLPGDFAATKKLQDWLVTLNSMRAMDNLTDEQARQLLFDLDQGYSAFHKWLKDKESRK